MMKSYQCFRKRTLLTIREHRLRWWQEGRDSGTSQDILVRFQLRFNESQTWGCREKRTLETQGILD